MLFSSSYNEDKTVFLLATPLPPIPLLSVSIDAVLSEAAGQVLWSSLLGSHGGNQDLAQRILLKVGKSPVEEGEVVKPWWRLMVVVRTAVASALGRTGVVAPSPDASQQWWHCRVTATCIYSRMGSRSCTRLAAMSSRFLVHCLFLDVPLCGGTFLALVLLSAWILQL